MQYQLLADIRVSHEYCRGICQSFAFVATEAAENDALRRNIIIRESMGNLKILAPEGSCSDLDTLHFGVFARDLDLYSVSMLNPGQGRIPVAVVKNGSVSFSDCSMESMENEFGLNKPLFGLDLRLPKDGESSKELNSVNIPLKTRYCRWRYFIQGCIDLDDLSIQCLRDDDQPDFEVERKNDRLVVFTSAKKYPIIYGDEPRFQLRTKKTSRLLLKALPNMDYRSLSRMETGDNGYEIVAESFVNL